jgi:hypothetical protein
VEVKQEDPFVMNFRRGPDGYKSLCNACGIHFAKILKKEEKAQMEYQPKALKLCNLLNDT